MTRTITESGMTYTWNEALRCWVDENNNWFKRIREQRIEERDGKKFMVDGEMVFKPIDKIFNDNYRTENKFNPTEKAPSFRSRW